MASAIAEKLHLVGADVSYATAQPVVAGWTDMTLEQDRIIERLKSLNIPLHVNTTIQNQTLANSLTGETTHVKGHIIIVGHRTPNDSLFRETSTLLGTENVTLCGDALVPGTIQAAVHSGHRIARHLLGDPLAGNTVNREVPQILL